MTGEEPSNSDLDDSPDIYFDDTVECSFQQDPRETIKEESCTGKAPGTATAPAPQPPATKPAHLRPRKTARRPSSFMQAGPPDLPDSRSL